MFLRNVWKRLPCDSALYPRKTESSTVDNYVKIDKLGGTCSTDVINDKYEMLLLPLKEKAT